RKGDVAEKSLACQPQQDRGILADAPEHGQVLEFVEGLAQDVNALVFEFGEVVHGGLRGRFWILDFGFWIGSGIQNPKSKTQNRSLHSSNLEIHFLGHEGMDAALDFVEADPTPRSFVLAIGGLLRAGPASDGTITTIMQRVVGDLMVLDILPYR